MPNLNTTNDIKLWMLIIGCTPKGRHTEQHDVYFGIGHTIQDVLPQLNDFWPEAAGKMHLDAYQAITQVDGYDIHIIPSTITKSSKGTQLFFINLGGYKPGIMEEFHYKLVTVAHNKAEAIQAAKLTAFYKHTGYKGAASHIDDKYGIDVDDLYAIQDILPKALKQQYSIKLTKAKHTIQDELHIGYFKLSKLAKSHTTNT